MANDGEIYRLAQRFRRELLRGERRAANELVRAYGEIWRRIKYELDSLLEEIARRREAGEEVPISWLWESGRLQRLEAQIAAELRWFAQFTEYRVAGEQRDAVRAALQHVQEMVGAVGDIGVMGSLKSVPLEALSDLVGFLSDGTPLRRLLEELGREAGAAVRKALITGLALGRNPRDIAREVRWAFGGNLARALRVSRTETLRAYREASLRSYQANGDVVSGWIWYSALGERTCAACWAMHGTKHKLTERLNDHPNGRCTMIPIVRGYETEVRSGTELFEELSDEQKERILGKAAFQMYQEGKVTLADFVGVRHDSQWGAVRYKRSLRDIKRDKGIDE